jgi:prephenate dehydratase
MKRDFLMVKGMKKIAIQGGHGSYHDVAAHRYFEGEEITLICCATFEEVVRQVQRDSSVIALMAIENTIAGSLLQNYELIRNSHLRIIGEHKLRISHSLVCLPNEDWDDITEVNSHPIALMQCRQFLSDHAHLKVVEAEDTAKSAEKIQQQQLKGHAAICSKEAATLFGMKVLQEGIETNKHNFTRFLVLADEWQATDLIPSGSTKNKSSLVFALPHEEGSLSQVLSILTFYKINLTKIQSLPIVGHEWQYLFYVDVTFEDHLRFRQAVNAITPLTRELSILGEYTRK